MKPNILLFDNKDNLKVMTILKSLKIFLTTIFLLSFAENAISCSMYKVTMFGKTFVGNNEDSWDPNALIWFEKGKTTEYGSMFVGSDKLYAQGGMNERGLIFDGFSISAPSVHLKPNYLQYYNNLTKDVLKKCQNIDEAFEMLRKYDLRSINPAMFLFIDKSGKYLIVEPDTMIKGNDAKYILSNFCPSKTPDLNSVKIPFYQKGRKMLDAKADTSLTYLKSLSDTLHQNWKGLGGTMYTTIYDANEGIIFLYLFYDYKHQIKLNLKDELAKGDHIIEMASLFPLNPGYEKLKSYKTLFNNDILLSFFVFFAVLFSFSSIFFLVSFFKNRKTTPGTNNKHSKVKLLLFAVNIILLYYVVTLVRNEIIFYFPVHFIASYIPFLLLLLIFPLLRWNIKIHKENCWSNFSKWLFALNNLSYLTLIILFLYWLSYHIF